jgi:metallo-beta-lactamase class B
MRIAPVVKIALALSCALAQAASAAPADPANDPVNRHLAAATAAAGLDYGALLGRLCLLPQGGVDAATRAARDASPRPAGPPATPPRAAWYQPPGKVFDNLYFVGTSEHSAWLLRTSDGLILIDTLFEYAVRPEIIEGAVTLGLDPKTIKYVIISHGHGDHNQGAKILQDLGARVLMSEADWDLTLGGRPMPGGNPRREPGVTDGQTLTLGDTTVKLYITPGHTPGTLSLLFPVKDGATTRMVAYPGGTAFNPPQTLERFRQYAEAQRRFAKIAADAGATVLLSNHSAFDDAWHKARLIKAPVPGEANPFLVANGVQRYLTVMSECAEAQGARLMQDQATVR